MAEETKSLEDRFLGQLYRTHDHYMLTLFSVPYILLQEKESKFYGLKITYQYSNGNKGTLSLPEDKMKELYEDILKDDKIKMKSTTQFVNESLAWFFARTWETMINYYKEKYNLKKKSEIYKKIEECPWFWYARIIRNSLIHDRKITFPPIKSCPEIVEWNGKKLSKHEDEGKELPIDYFDPNDANKFHQSVRSLIESHKK